MRNTYALHSRKQVDQGPQDPYLHPTRRGKTLPDSSARSQPPATPSMPSAASRQHPSLLQEEHGEAGYSRAEKYHVWINSSVPAPGQEEPRRCFLIAWGTSGGAGGRRCSSAHPTAPGDISHAPRALLTDERFLGEW